jgi:predicted secreted protein
MDAGEDCALASVTFFGVRTAESDDVQAHRVIGSTATKSQFEMRRDVVNTTNLTGACSTNFHDIGEIL